MRIDIGNIRMDEPKTLGECWVIFKMFGFQRPKLPLDDSAFPNACRLVELNNQVWEWNKNFQAPFEIIKTPDT